MIRQTLFYFAARVGTGLLSIALLAAFTRLLSPVEYGHYVLAITLATIASVVFFQWLAVSAGRFYARYRDCPQVLLSAVSKSFWTSAAVAALLAVSVAAACWSAGLNATLILVVLLLTVAQGRFDLALQFANLRREPGSYAIASWLKTGIAAVAGSALLFIWPSGFAATTGVVLGLIVAARWPKFSDSTQLQPPTLELRREFLRYGSPLAANSLAFMVVSQSDRLFIASILGVAAVGPYAAAYDFAQQSIGAIMNVGFLVAYPSIVHTLEENGEQAARDQLIALARAHVTIGLARRNRTHHDR